MSHTKSGKLVQGVRFQEPRTQRRQRQNQPKSNHEHSNQARPQEMGSGQGESQAEDGWQVERKSCTASGVILQEVWRRLLRPEEGEQLAEQVDQAEVAHPGRQEG